MRQFVTREAEELLTCLIRDPVYHYLVLDRIPSIKLPMRDWYVKCSEGPPALLPNLDQVDEIDNERVKLMLRHMGVAMQHEILKGG